MKKEKYLYCIILILVILLIYVAIYKIPKSTQLVGTYKQGDTYIALDVKGEFVEYADGKILFEGIYYTDDGKIYYARNETAIIAFIYSDDKIYTFDLESNTILPFEKVAKEPTYVNIDYII